MWRNISIPQYVVKGEYVEMFSYLDEAFSGNRETALDVSKVKSDINAAILWIRDYVADCCSQCSNSLN